MNIGKNSYIRIVRKWMRQWSKLFAARDYRLLQIFICIPLTKKRELWITNDPVTRLIKYGKGMNILWFRVILSYRIDGFTA